MINVLLKLLAIVLGLLIVAVIILKCSNLSIGVRTARNNFTGVIANVSILTWLLVLLILSELTVCALVVFSFGARS
jgi:hypothetical protein